MKFTFFLRKNRARNLEVAAHSHNCCEITFYFSGTGRVDYAYPDSADRKIDRQLAWISGAAALEKSIDFVGATAVYMPPHTIHNEIHFAPQMDLVSVGFELDDGETPLPKAARVFDADKFIGENLYRIENLFNSREYLYVENINAYLLLTYNRILQHENRKTPPIAENADFEYVINYFDEYFMTSIDVKSVASSINYCPDHFRILFRQKTGLSPKQYIIKKRLEYAHTLIRGSDMSLKQIAERCGYEDYVQFNAIFKKHYGIAPSALKSRPQP